MRKNCKERDGALTYYLGLATWSGVIHHVVRGLKLSLSHTHVCTHTQRLWSPHLTPVWP